MLASRSATRRIGTTPPIVAVIGPNSVPLPPELAIHSATGQPALPRSFHGDPVPGREVRAAQLSSRAGVSHRRDPDAGARDRRDDGDLQHAERGAAQAAALPAAGRSL